MNEGRDRLNRNPALGPALGRGKGAAAPRPDANRLAHETIREQTRQAGTGQDRETAKPLVKHTPVDPRLVSETAVERLRA
jgi:hypothetical protein